MAGSNFAVSPGSWVVTGESNGAPGRGMSIEVRDGTLVMAVYNYTATGAATFHLTAGAMNGNSFTGKLMEYQGGRWLGGPARDATEVKSAGEVKLSFSNSTTGTVQFPGEQALPMSRFVFNAPERGKFLSTNVGEAWLLTELDSKNQPVRAGVIAINQNDSHIWSDLGDCTVNSGTAAVTCATDWDRTTASVTLQRYGQRLEGSISSNLTAQKARVVGSRLLQLRFGNQLEVMYDTPDMAWTRDRDSSYNLPEPGMWIISDERTGKPGRGMSLDVQFSKLVLLMYGYESNGSPTFRIGSGDYLKGESSVALQKVRGGRYFGGPARTGSNVSTDGNAKLRFTSSTTGAILLPGEEWVAIEKFTVGRVSPQPEALLGTWMLWNDAAVGSFAHKVFTLTRVEGAQATSEDGEAKCGFVVTAQGTVRCTDSWGEYRFTPAYNDGASMGWSMQMNALGQVVEGGDHDLMSAQRIVDHQGVVSGALNKP